MRMIERERTYLLQSLPVDLHEFPMKEIVDVYIPLRNGMAQLRARKKWDNYEMTKKFPVYEWFSAVQEEHTIRIDSDEFDYLYTYLPYIIKKKRYSYKVKGISWTITYDIDVFAWVLEGLLMADVEFEDEQCMESFLPPSFLGEEVTHDTRFAWGILTQLKRHDAERFVKEVMK